MSAKYEKSQGTKISITSLPATLSTLSQAIWLSLSCSLKETQFTAGQKNDIDVTALCSEETENINGLAAQSEITFNGNFYPDEAQNALRTAYDNDGTYGFKVVFPSGNGFQFIAEVRQHTWSAGTNGVVAATFSLRLKGKPTKITPVTGISVNPSTSIVGVGETETFSVVFEPTDATERSFTAVSSSPSIATAVINGLSVVVTGVSDGDAIITVTSEDGSFTATHNVTVDAD